MTVDELLTIFFAGSQTSSNVTQNLIIQLALNPECKQKVLDEIKENPQKNIQTQVEDDDFYGRNLKYYS